MITVFAALIAVFLNNSVFFCFEYLAQPNSVLAWLERIKYFVPAENNVTTDTTER